MKPKLPQITLSQCILGWEQAAESRRLSPHTISDYNNTYKKFAAFLFCARSGRRMDRNNLGNMIESICHRASIPVYSPHDFRHTFAITYLRNYPNIYTLKEMMGHCSYKTLKRYLAISQNDITAAHRIASPVENLGIR